ncbi:hypothetical protein OJAV_G00060060 [Oryzias javanicus]|uniref:Uncharacterized protein n=1 Tax=Oryzias javanicus TaxID=123683 RepID=A0A437DBK7_ORYJA|nr:hypothetical protein OJAV_G00060060 [Oryzias javanicus]
MRSWLDSSAVNQTRCARSVHCCNFCRLLTPQTCRTIAEVNLSPWLVCRGATARGPQVGFLPAQPLQLPSPSPLLSSPRIGSDRIGSFGYEFCAFSSLMNRASNAGDHGDPLLRASRWQIFTEFGAGIPLWP